jgi:sporulation protein YlmC with PRC-barrel domain
MKKSLLAGAAVLAGTCYAMAADFYVVQDTATKQCRVAEQRPTGSAMVIVGAERSYASQAEAEAALKASSICNQTTAQAPTGKAPTSSAPAGGTTTAQAPAGGTGTVGVGGGDTKIMTDVPPNSMPVTNFYKQNVYDPGNNKIGEVDDVLVGADGKINALVIGVGGFLGIGEKHVIVPFSAVKADRKDNKWQLVMNSTKDDLKAAPGFKYDRTNTVWVKET